MPNVRNFTAVCLVTLLTIGCLDHGKNNPPDQTDDNNPNPVVVDGKVQPITAEVLSKELAKIEQDKPGFITSKQELQKIVNRIRLFGGVTDAEAVKIDSKFPGANKDTSRLTDADLEVLRNIK